MSFVSPIVAAAKRSRIDVMASRPLLVALLVVAVFTALRLTGTVDSDVAWQLWIAGRMHAGAQLYRDIIEVNPPLWFWMALPVDRVSTLLQLRIEAVLTLAVGCFAAVSLAATDRFLVHLEPRRHTMLLAFAAVALLGISWVHMGQREQIALIGTLPYCALIAARREGKSVSPRLAFLIGVLAAAGFALKHYFLLIPALLELWLLSGKGRSWRPLRPETIAIAVIGALYVIAVLLWAPAFLTTVVPLVRLSYGGLGAPGLQDLVGPYAAVGLVSLAMLAAHAKELRKASLASALAVAALGFTAAYFIQAKGWNYHTIPILGCSSLAIAALLAESGAPMRLLRLAGPAFLALPLLFTVQEKRHAMLPSPDLNAAVAGVQPGESVGFLTTETAVPWSVTLQHKLGYPSRYMGFWMLPAIVQNEALGSPDPRLAALGRQIVAETVHDFACSPPRRIIVARPRPGETGFDILPFFERDPQFTALLSHYRSAGRTTFDVYELATPLPSVRGCTTTAQLPSKHR